MINIKQLTKLYNSGLLNLSALARETKINYDTLHSKIKNNSELKVDESEKIEKAFVRVMNFGIFKD